MKRLLLFIAYVLCSLATLAADFTVDGISYRITSTSKLTVEVTSSDPQYCGDVVIPEKVENGGNTYSVTSIGYWAFSGCSGLTSVTIPNSVIYIRLYAFEGCSGLTSVTIPNSVTSIGDGAFSGCIGLQKVIVEDIAAWCSISFSSNPLQYAHHLYSDENTEIKDLIIPNSVTSIERSTFQGCSSLTTVTIGNSVASIGDNAFNGCSSLKSINFPRSIKKIGVSAFDGCNNIEKVIIEDVGAWCSLDVQWMKVDGLYLDSHPLALPHHLYCDEDTEITDLVIPEGVEKIHAGAFVSCSNLKSVTIPSSIKSIGGHAFDGCIGLEKVIIKDIAAWCSANLRVDRDLIYRETATYYNYTDYGSNPLCFAHRLYKDENTEISDLVIPEGVTTINSIAFLGCTSIKSVIIPNSVTTIEGVCENTVRPWSYYGAFEGCINLTKVTFGKNLTSVGPAAFPGGIEVHVPDLESWCKIKFKSSMESPLYGECGNPLNGGGRLYVNEEEVKDMVIPTSVNKIEWCAFQGCASLTSVTIPNSVTSIGDFAFTGCENIEMITLNCKKIGNWFGGLKNIKKVILGDEVTSIGYHAFSGCSGLASIKVESGNSKYDSRNNCNAIIETSTNTLIAGCKNTTIPNSVTSIGNEAFYSCSGLTSVTIPNSVTSIGDWAFRGCDGLTSVTIPNSVTSIGSDAFQNCSSLTEVVSLIEEPFEINKSVFVTYIEGNFVFTGATLFIPVGTKEKYEATAAWNKFANIVERGIAPEDNGDVNYGGNGEIGDGTDLSGTVVGNVFYSIADGNGNYSSTEGCIVVKKPTTDEQVSQVEGTDLFGEQMKDNFTGIIFKIEPGSGTVKVTAETTGDMTLKIKIGDGAPMEFKLNGMMEAKLPYTVDAPTYVYIYAGSAEASGAKGARKAAGNGELKIYGISWGDDSTDGISYNNRETINNNRYYNLNGQRVEKPTKKGVYIVNGKKAVYNNQ